ncbi:FtsQ-type POTRA domain-containing protein|uniref:Cell division protein FtsQ n=1 Tax=Dendrosporobacter quercicolus TaxID=146817 RepID=A0A1G9MCI9_9FIRM|nr:FtsQ-type POTRA domain-containing protein [Dendrosporobacter quercicolus]NSL46997.1 FtsQ-type POTRA domain-containing protein [Dendrosporobacter quercicolus DSM 1736]SDL71978.1 cell division protein FtsQ [Dendrosporobacter quercicolus]
MREPERLEYKPRERQEVPRRLFSWLLFVLIVLIAGFLFLNSSVFTVGPIVTQGNKYMSDEEILRVAALPERVNIFRLNIREIEQRLSRDLRVAEVHVSREFPGTIVISIVERKPLAYIANSYGFVEVDKQGVVLAVYKNLKKIRVPMITGVRLESGYVGDQVQDREVTTILSYLANIDEATLDQLSEVNISGGHIFAYTNNSIQIRVGSAERLVEKAELTQAMLKEILEKNLIVEYIDLNFSSPVIKFQTTKEGVS